MNLPRWVPFATTLEESSNVRRNHGRKPGGALATRLRRAEARNLHSNRTARGADFLLGTGWNRTRARRLLHFFANHELLATELMALVLPKFPDAPAALPARRAAKHSRTNRNTRGLLSIHACGIEFGELP